MNSSKNTGDAVSQEVWAVVENKDDSHINVDDYTGIYKDPWFGTMEVFMNGDKL
jgi:hypothetical protein